MYRKDFNYQQKSMPYVILSFGAISIVISNFSRLQVTLKMVWFSTGVQILAENCSKDHPLAWLESFQSWISRCGLILWAMKL